MKFLTLLKNIAFISVVVSTSTIIVLIHSYFQSSHLVSNSYQIDIEIGTKTQTETTGNSVVPISNIIAETTEDTINFHTSSAGGNSINKTSVQNQHTSNSSTLKTIEEAKEDGNRRKVENIFKMFTMTTTRGFALDGIFIFTQVIASAFLLVTDKKEAKCRTYSWMITAVCSTMINMLTLVGAVGMYSKVIENQNYFSSADSEIYIERLNKFNFIYKYYIMTGIYMVVHSLGTFILLCCLRSPKEYNYKLLMTNPA